MATVKETRAKLEEKQKQLYDIEKCLQDTESRNNLLGFFETLIEIAIENPEIIQESSHLQSLKSEDKK